MGVAKPTISLYESAERWPQPEDIERIASALEVSTSDLLCERDEMEGRPNLDHIEPDFLELVATFTEKERGFVKHMIVSTREMGTFAPPKKR